MREGAWINGTTGRYAWIPEHASWIKVPDHARALGMPEAVIAKLEGMPWDFNGPARKAILLEAMGQGFIRVRGHGADCTFEHTLPQEQAIRAAWPFMSEQFGPEMLVRFTNLVSMAVMEVRFGDLRDRLSSAEVAPSGVPCRR